MQSLGRVLAADPGRGPGDDYWYEPRMVTTVTDLNSAEAAMTIPAVYACVAYTAEDMAKLPLSMYEDLGDAGSKPARDHELQDLLHNQPNKHQDAFTYKEMVTAFAVLRGRGVSEILEGPSISVRARPTRRDVIAQIVPLHPDLVRKERTRDGDRRWVYRDPDRGYTDRPINSDDVFVLNGRLGRSVMDFAASNLGTELAKERLGQFMFSRGAKHQGVITHPSKMPDPVRTALRKSLDEYAIDGPRAGRPLLLEDGMTWTQVSMTARDAELLASQQFTVSQVCRWFRVPPHKVFDLTRSTNNNIETQGVDYVVDSLLGWASRWEQAIWRDLIVDKRFFAKLTLDALLRGDFEARSKAYALAIMWGWMTRNEVRAKEDLNPIDGLDAPLTPENMTTDPNGDPVVLQPRRGEQALLGAPAVRSLDVVDVGRLKLIASDKASQIVRREMAEMSRLAERTAGDATAWAAGVDAFYGKHGQDVATQLHIPDPTALRYAREQREALLNRGASVMDDWLVERAAHLAHLAADDKLEELEAA